MCLYFFLQVTGMDAEGFDSLEQLNEYKSVAGQTFLRSKIALIFTMTTHLVKDLV
jgi:hypothetical protein